MMSTSRRPWTDAVLVGTVTFSEQQGRSLRKVSSTIGGGDTARFATEHACRGMRRGARSDGRDRQLTIVALEAGPTLEEPKLLSFPDSAQEFRDRSTGLPLNPEMVKRARELEIAILHILHSLFLLIPSTVYFPSSSTHFVPSVSIFHVPLLLNSFTVETVNYPRPRAQVLREYHSKAGP